MSIEARNISHRFGSYQALDGIDLTVEPGQLVALLGPSGSGKTTLLRIIAGLEHPDKGAVYLDGVDTTREPTQRRRVGFVFQHYALFNHLTIFENIAFGLRVRPRRQRPLEGGIRDRVRELLALVQLVVKPTKPAPQVLADACIKGAEGLVEQQHPGLDRERTRKRHPLPLAAR